MLISGLLGREISCFLKTTAKKLEDQYIVGPSLKVGGTSLPRSLRLLLLCVRLSVCLSGVSHSRSVDHAWLKISITLCVIPYSDVSSFLGLTVAILDLGVQPKQAANVDIESCTNNPQYLGNGAR